MRPTSRITAWAATLATAAAATIALTGSPAAASGGGFWSTSCGDGRACIKLAPGHSNPAGPFWNIDGCGYHTINDYYGSGYAHGNAFDVHYADQRWDRVEAWTSRGLDPNNRVTGVTVLC
ncbi:hypothetical protein ABZ776_31430 [Streptomyces sp. NPDC007076]|uniref:hypothetical protein n=1 Tax=unclassified Streptomyces TaxID=2593676 RepID=UPI002E798778|nr:hypothetical protein [Streptomyces sp. JV190]MEE1844036.1 hypothetical protein [Streptomyces sp. JV190]